MKRSESSSGDGPRAVGRLSVHPAGYGFVVVDDGSDDVFVPAKFRGSALDGDRVVLSTWAGYKGTEGRVEDILARGRAKLTGVVGRSGRAVVLVPDDPRIATDQGQIPLDEGTGGARDGQAVLAEITRYPTREHPGMAARVVRVLGDPEDPRTEIEKIIACADIPSHFPDQAQTQAERTAQLVGPEDLADRIDLRDRAFLTIDPETARDFDDALCIEETTEGWRVWVAVADVSHYVRPGDALDREAVIRGVSVYLPDRVIPMLPFELSSGICSLNPEVDRCAMVVRIDFDEDGQVLDTGFAAAVIRSRARLDYPGVAAALNGDFRGRREQYRVWREALILLDRLAQILRERRAVRGALELEMAEAKVLLDEDDPLLVRDVVRAKGNEDVKRAYQLVEEMMIAANEAVGAFFSTRDLATVWRVHAPPLPARVEALAETLSGYGIDVDLEEAQTPLGMRKVVEQLRDLPAAQSLNFLVLRALKQAIYSTENVGHFGLASEEYIHFTSPIRRYPDLLAHRLIKHALHREGQAAGGGGRWRPPSSAELAELATASSAHERRAMEAEREAVAMYRAYLMREQVGEVLPGRVSAITAFGAFVEIDEPFVEGLIKMEALGDEPFAHDARGLRLIGRHTGRMLALGDRVTVEVLSVSVTLRRIELRLVEGGTRGGERRKPPERRAKPRPDGAKGDRRKNRERGGGGGGGKGG
ncbi:MAG TPA: ribonuclease R, partial [Kofleriaceae bacterium]|nr:ribonuclease R [Kofleriaceae bacterium]